MRSKAIAHLLANPDVTKTQSGALGRSVIIGLNIEHCSNRGESVSSLPRAIDFGRVVPLPSEQHVKMPPIGDERSLLANIVVARDTMENAVVGTLHHVAPELAGSRPKSLIGRHASLSRNLCT